MGRPLGHAAAVDEPAGAREPGVLRRSARLAALAGHRHPPPGRRAAAVQALAPGPAGSGAERLAGRAAAGPAVSLQRLREPPERAHPAALARARDAAARLPRRRLLELPAIASRARLGRRAGALRLPLRR